jgi:hypothetical protein
MESFVPAARSGQGGQAERKGRLSASVLVPWNGREGQKSGLTLAVLAGGVLPDASAAPVLAVSREGLVPDEWLGVVLPQRRVQERSASTRDTVW